MKDKNKNFFRDWEEQEHDEDYQAVNHFKGESKSLLDIAWKLGTLNLLWVERQLNNCDIPCVCKHIITKCRDFRRNADRLCLTAEDRYHVDESLKNAQHIMFRFLTCEIANYCMED
jgi:hypothetical protein